MNPQLKFLFTASLLISLFSACLAQKNTSLLGGPCQGCEALYEYGNKMLTAIDTLPGFEKNEPQLHMQGTVYQQDGETPASDVILYIYHTNRSGIYEKKGDEKGWAKRHGFIRGWVKTGDDGKYEFYTFRPGAYPDRGEPEHIHITIKEPGKREYYIEDFFFEDDPLLNSSKLEKLKQRGGSGIVKPLLKKGQLEVRRDIILGLNIPNYE